MATHSSVLPWRIPGTVEPDGLLSMGLHRVGHDLSVLAAASVAAEGHSEDRWVGAWHGKDEWGSCYPCACGVSIWRGVVEALDVFLAGKQRTLEACTFSLLLILECAATEPFLVCCMLIFSFWNNPYVWNTDH